MMNGPTKIRGNAQEPSRYPALSRAIKLAIFGGRNFDNWEEPGF